MRTVALAFALASAVAAGLLVGYRWWGRDAKRAAGLEQRAAALEAEVENLTKEKAELDRRVEQISKEQERLARENEWLRQQRVVEQLTGEGSQQPPPTPPK